MVETDRSLKSEHDRQGVQAAVNDSVVGDAVEASGAGLVPLIRLPLFQQDRTVWGYALAVTDRIARVYADREKALVATYAELNLPELALDRPVFLWATRSLLDGSAELPAHSGVLGLIIHPNLTADDQMPKFLAEVSAHGVMTVLFDYHSTTEQDALLSSVSHVMIDYSNADQDAGALAATARGAGVSVIAENLLPDDVRDSWPGGSDLVMGSIFGSLHPERDLTAGEVQCLEAVRLLSEDEVDTPAVARVMGADPTLILRVLRLVNSASEGLPRRVDSVQQAIILLGPTRVAGMVMASLISSTVKNVDNLWLQIARGAACRELAETDAAYTAGLLSAFSFEAGIPARKLVEQARLSPEVAAAITNGEGELGQVLTAVIEYEHGNEPGIEATGLSVEKVAMAYLNAIPWALSTVISAVSSE